MNYSLKSGLNWLTDAIETLVLGSRFLLVLVYIGQILAMLHLIIVF
jgi:hypothetical protein